MKWKTANILDYNLLKGNAQANRSNMTEAESALWQMAKGNGLGQKCRRQYVIGDYIVDFFFRQSMLIVEIDGGYHFTEEQQEEDKARQDWLEQQGYQVLRFTNEQVLVDTDNTINEIRKHLNNKI
ncbi:MAG: DUF559 domain-containing protein [Bacteroidaceae bacterium]|nr:DUF559 domain-containing protein [Bacteroidaceae bacterium]MBQ9170147.1 DUF559 domain-containing protein [Bacteroidaceae bacterium]MBQ9294776.1 DUF559 domain-containing protein [Bacteroidaceae bacterium]